MFLIERRDALKLALCAGVALGAPQARAAIRPQKRVVTDHAGRQVEVPAVIRRAVIADVFPLASLATLFLGGAERIAGIHPVSMAAAKSGLLGTLFPGILRADTGFMTGSSLSIESLLRLKPDCVLVNAANTREISLLETARIPAVAFSATGFGYDVMNTLSAWVSLLAAVFPDEGRGKRILSGVGEAAATARRRVGARTAGIPEGERGKALFLFQYGQDRIVVSGRNFFGESWCRMIGARNAAESVTAKNANAAVSIESVYAWNPDVIFISNFTPAMPSDLYQNRYHKWSGVKAVREKRVYKMPLGTYRTFTPSADAPVTLLWLAKMTYPKLFADVDLRAEAKAYYEKAFGKKLRDADVTRLLEPGRVAGLGARIR